MHLPKDYCILLASSEENSSILNAMCNKPMNLIGLEPYNRKRWVRERDKTGNHATILA